MHLQWARFQRLRDPVQERAELGAILICIASPGMRAQGVQHCRVLRMLQADIRKPGIDGIAGAQRRAGQCQKQPGSLRHPAQQPAAADIGNRPTLISGIARRERSVTTRWLAPDIKPMPPPMTMPWPQHSTGLG